MSEADQKQVASAFQIGGIHGMPYTEWDGSGGEKPVSDEWEGYCTHGSVLFPIWHRPYVAVYEVRFCTLEFIHSIGLDLDRNVCPLIQ